MRACWRGWMRRNLPYPQWSLMKTWWVPRVFQTEVRHKTTFRLRWPPPATTDGDSQAHFVYVVHLCAFAFGQNSPWLARLTANTKNTLFQNVPKPFENQLKSVPCLVP